MVENKNSMPQSTVGRLNRILDHSRGMSLRKQASKCSVSKIANMIQSMNKAIKCLHSTQVTVI